MLKTGAEYLESLLDGRKIYVGSELVDDVVSHPLFAGGARTVAAIYDRKAAADDAELLSFEENSERYSSYWCGQNHQKFLFQLIQ
jgi:4-hydroxyphenylacetate 3-monooxygenase